MLEHLAAGDVDRATVLARRLAHRFPRFTLGQLLHAELSAVAALDGTLVGAGHAWSPALIDLLLEARARLPAADDRPASDPPAVEARVPGSLPPGSPVSPDSPWPPRPFVQIGPHVANVVLVDLERSALALYTVSGGVATRVREHYVSSGSAGFGKRREGDRKTPLGLYRITGHHTDAALPELYGSGALVLDYPNPWDRARGRTGSGIWLHGVPRARLSRAPRSSEGCVTMSNEHLDVLVSRLERSRTLVALTAGDGHVAHGRAGGADGASPDAADDALSRGDARARYRALFRDWRERRVAAWLEDGTRVGADGHLALPATDLAALADVDENDVTILESTADGFAGSREILIMDVALDVDGGNGITLWWSRLPRDGGWALELAHRRAADA